MKRSHSLSLALALLAGALAVLGVSFAQDASSETEAREQIPYQSCTFDGKSYSHHALLCMEGILYRCDGAGTSGMWKTYPDGKCAEASEARSCLYKGLCFGVGAVKDMEGTVYECTDEGKWKEQEDIEAEVPADPGP